MASSNACLEGAATIFNTYVQTEMCLPPTQVWGMEKNKFISVTQEQLLS